MEVHGDRLYEVGHRPGGMARREQTLVGLVEIQTKIFEILQSYGSEHKFRAHQGLITTGNMFLSVLKGVLLALKTSGV